MMPVRSLTSPVLKWPDRKTVDLAVRECATVEIKRHPEAHQPGYFGSYARGDWSVGSAPDLIAIVANSLERFKQRSLSWEIMTFPVPAELLVYTEKEWERIQKENGLFVRTIGRETMWVYKDKSFIA